MTYDTTNYRYVKMCLFALAVEQAKTNILDMADWLVKRCMLAP